MFNFQASFLLFTNQIEDLGHVYFFNGRDGKDGRLKL